MKIKIFIQTIYKNDTTLIIFFFNYTLLSPRQDLKLYSSSVRLDNQKIFSHTRSFDQFFWFNKQILLL